METEIIQVTYKSVGTDLYQVLNAPQKPVVLSITFEKVEGIVITMLRY